MPALFPYRYLYYILHIRNIGGRIGTFFTVHPDCQNRQPCYLLDFDVRTPWIFQESLIFSPPVSWRTSMSSPNTLLPGHCAPCNKFIKTHLDRLGKFIIISRYLLQMFLKLMNQIIPGSMRVWPGRPGLEHYESIGNAWRHRVCCNLRSPYFGKTLSASGNSFIFFSRTCCISTACDRLVPGMRRACIRRSPSSKPGKTRSPCALLKVHSEQRVRSLL